MIRFITAIVFRNGSGVVMTRPRPMPNAQPCSMPRASIATIGIRTWYGSATNRVKAGSEARLCEKPAFSGWQPQPLRRQGLGMAHPVNGDPPVAGIQPSPRPSALRLPPIFIACAYPISRTWDARGDACPSIVDEVGFEGNAALWREGVDRMVLTEGFLLGIASGGVCLAYCTPVLVPYLLGEGEPVRSSAIAVGGFLGGRLVGYLAFAILAWLTHFALVDHLPHQRIVIGVATVILALLLIAYGFAGRSQNCKAAAAGARLGRLPLRNPMLVPILLGLMTGVNVCPPFLMAFGNAAQFSTLRQSLAFFAAFFVGTSVYIVPLSLVGMVGRHEAVRIIGRLASGVVGLFYLYSGVVNVLAGMR